MKYKLQNVLGCLFIALCQALPIYYAVRLGAFIGTLFYFLDRRHRSIAMNNLVWALGMDKEETKRIAQASYQNLGRTVTEFISASKKSGKEIQQSITIEGWEHFRAAQQQRRGVIILTAHFGNWEWLAQRIALQGSPFYVVARPLDNPYFNERVNEWRGRHGNQVLNKRVAANQILHLLRAGESVGFLLDQNTAEKDAVFVDYFGHPAATNKGLAVIALRTRSPVLPVFILREKGREDRHRLVIEKPLTLIRSGKLQEDVVANTAIFTQKIESYVRQYPDHWLWVHRRWKTQKGNRVCLE